MFGIAVNRPELLYGTGMTSLPLQTLLLFPTEHFENVGGIHELYLFILKKIVFIQFQYSTTKSLGSFIQQMVPLVGQNFHSPMFQSLGGAAVLIKVAFHSPGAGQCFLKSNNMEKGVQADLDIAY